MNKMILQIFISWVCVLVAILPRHFWEIIRSDQLNHVWLENMQLLFFAY